METASRATRPPEHARMVLLWRRLIWIACLIPLMQTALLFTVADPRSPYGIAVQLLRPLGTFYAATLLFLAAVVAHGERRRCWTSLGLSILGGAIYGFARAAWDTPMTTPSLQALLPVIYGCGLAGFAFYFHQHTRFIGNVQRLVVGAIVMAIAGFVVVRTVLPVVRPDWDWSMNVPLTFIAFDLGLLFAFAIVYQRRRSPSTFMAILAASCLLFADVVNVVVTSAPWGSEYHQVILPIYTLHAALLAFNAHLDVLYPVEDLRQQTRQEWLVWSLAPLCMVLAALLADRTLRATNTPAVTILLIGMLLAYSVVSELDSQRTNRELEALRQRAFDESLDAVRSELIDRAKK